MTITTKNTPYSLLCKFISLDDTSSVTNKLLVLVSKYQREIAAKEDELFHLRPQYYDINDSNTLDVMPFEMLKLIRECDKLKYICKIVSELFIYYNSLQTSVCYLDLKEKKEYIIEFDVSIDIPKMTLILTELGATVTATKNILNIKSKSNISQVAVFNRYIAP
jgi:hypothetical protein